MFNKNDFVFIIAGSNDCNCKSSFNFDVEILKQIAKRTTLYVLNVPERFDCKDCNNSVSMFNNVLKIKANNEFVCVNLIHIFKRNDYSSHGLHLKFSGKEKMAKLICNLVYPCPFLQTNMSFLTNRKMIKRRK